MPADSSAPSGDPRRGPTFTERARRAQLVAVTVDLIARHGYQRCSLQRIADAAGITKAAVIYHFTSKDAVIRAAYSSVIASLTEQVGAAVESARTPAAAVEAYLRAMLGHMAANPSHVRVIVEALDGQNDTGIEDRRSPARWQPLAALIDAAAAAGEYRPDVDSRVLAIILGGAVDAVVAETLADPTFDLVAATGAVLAIADTARPQ
ncbi:TetR/AcrR family transcriptional regulator [Actinoplanes sp. NEAU-A12]|uniref:TetR/AcrR family transcriptional regulator n=1 Tax=Actinoplanes sandaracinus TaxID=3045177 RepID=A0ABT6X171_9ACTN|nr:TetR/AcrR family transcriptional regulator [Actinoplanes sandaracinus]MDI6105761.1 TetR/AcrR family transcriptional regulator [Actinoplanes sandaracinus]